MPNDRNTRIAQALEPEPGPLPEFAWERVMAGSYITSPLEMYRAVCRYDSGDKAKWEPLPFDTDENAFRLAWVRLTEPQRYAFKALVYDVACNDGHSGAWMTMANSTLAQRCDWLLAVLEGKP